MLPAAHLGRWNACAARETYRVTDGGGVPVTLVPAPVKTMGSETVRLSKLATVCSRCGDAYLSRVVPTHRWKSGACV